MSAPVCVQHGYDNPAFIISFNAHPQQKMF